MDGTVGGTASARPGHQAADVRDQPAQPERAEAATPAWAEESPQRVIQIRIHSLVGCSVPAGQAMVKVRLGSASQEVAELETPMFPVVNGVCWMESWLRVPSEATWAELEVVRTHVSSFGYKFRAIDKALGTCHFFLPHPFEGWVHERQPLMRISTFQDQLNRFGPEADEESSDGSGEADVELAEANRIFDSPGSISQVVEEDPRERQQLPAPDTVSSPVGLQAPPAMVSVLRRTTSVQRATASYSRQHSRGLNQGESFYQQLRTRFTVDTGARLVISTRVLEAQPSPSLAVESEIEVLDRPLHSYAHGGFMGSAISMMADPYWREVLQDMEPANAKRCMQLAVDESIPEAGRMKLMAFLENSPVLCVYGLARSGCIADMKRAVGPSDVALEDYGGSLTPSDLPSGAEGAVEGMGSRVPIALEWDLWIDPKAPQQLDCATIDHGSVTALVQQTVLKGAGCLSVAELAGQKHIKREGMSPPQWLTILGEVVNLTAQGSKTQPLYVPELEMSKHRSARVTVDVLGFCLSGSQGNTVSTDELMVSVEVGDNPWKVPPAKVNVLAAGPWDSVAPLSLWPLDSCVVDNGILKVTVKKKTPGAGAAWKKYGAATIRLQDLIPSGLTVSSPDGAEVAGTQVVPRGWEGQLEINAASSLQIRVSLQGVSAMEAYAKIGVPNAAAQTCMMILSDPGGLYLDVKSAYSTADHVETFAAALTALGIKTHAACSFVPAQLPISIPTVLFFHGMSGLENACDDQKVIPGQQVLFNGASFLRDIYEDPESLSDGHGVHTGFSSGGGVSSAPPALVDPVAFTNYQALVALYSFKGGIYIQEPDCSSACADALTWLVNTHPEYFPLGFAYGHVAGISLSYASLTGRGFAAQQLMEELEARKRLSNKVALRIDNLEHRKEPLAVTKAWADRLLHGHKIITVREQRLLLQLLGDVQPTSELSNVVAYLGGVPHLFTRFLLHYEASTPFTQHETGYDWNYTKPLLRLLRDRGAFAALTAAEKIQLVLFLASPGAYGKGLQYWLQRTGFRASLHKLAKECLACLWESSTSKECRAMTDAMGGNDVLGLLLKGHSQLSWSYWRRVRDVFRLHNDEPSSCSLLFCTPGWRYSALEERQGEAILDLKHIRRTRAVPLGEQLGKQLRRLSCCMVTCGCFTWACLCSCGCSSALLIRMCLPWCDNRFCSASVVFGVTIAAISAIFVTIGLLMVAAALLDPSLSAALAVESFLLEGSLGVFTIDLGVNS